MSVENVCLSAKSGRSFAVHRIDKLSRLGILESAAGRPAIVYAWAKINRKLTQPTLGS